MTFSKALKILKKGGTVRRRLWDRGYFLLVVDGYICIKDQLIDHGSWTITSIAVLADDWAKVEEL